MISTKPKFILDKTSLINIAVDLLLSISVGFVVSVLFFLLAAWGVGGRSSSFAELFHLFDSIFSRSSGERAEAQRLVLLIPILLPPISILLARRFVQKVESEDGWSLPIIVVAVTSTIVGISCMVFLPILFGLRQNVSLKDITWLLRSSPFFVFLIIAGYLVGGFLRRLFSPKRRVFKILVAVISSATVGGLYEIWLLLLGIR